MPTNTGTEMFVFFLLQVRKIFLNFFKNMLDLDQFLSRETIFLIFCRHQVFIYLSTTYLSAAINMTVLNICRAPQQHSVIRQWD